MSHRVSNGARTRTVGRAQLAAGFAAVALWTGTALAQATPPPRWDRTLVVTTGYGEHDGGTAASQSLALYLSRPDRYWILSMGHQRLMRDDGYGAGASFQRAWKGRYRAGGGVSTGVNSHGGLYPRYHAGINLGMNLTDPLQVSLGLSRRRSGIDRRHEDRVGVGFTSWGPGRLIIGGGATYGIAQPGSTTSWSSGGGVTYAVWEKWSAGMRVDYGDGSYMLLPGQGIVEFRSWAWSGSVSRNFTARNSVRITSGHTDYYGGFHLGLAVAHRW